MQSATSASPSTFEPTVPSSRKRSAIHLDVDSDASMDVAPSVHQRRRKGIMQNTAFASSLTSHRLALVEAALKRIERRKDRSRIRCSSGGNSEDNSDDEDDKSAVSSTSAKTSAPLSPPAAIDSSASMLDESDDDEDEEEERTHAPSTANATTAASQSTATTTQNPVTKLNSLPSTALLTRLTRKPSPVHIPPNSIGLTYLHEFLTTEECAELIMVSQGKFARSMTYGGVSSARTSHTTFLPARAPLVQRILQRVSELTGAADRRITVPQVVRYEPGQQFKPHVDSTLHGLQPPLEFTVFVYLNTLVPDAGGETEFTKIGVKFTPKEGDALIWRNHKDRRSPHLLDGKHAGRPPLSGVKYGMNIFVRFD